MAEPRINMELDGHEAAVVAAMRDSQQARKAIFRYAATFAPPDEDS